MLFNSYIFILFFLPCALVLYYGFNHFHKESCAKAMLVIMSLWFYAYFHVSYLFILLSSILFNFGISKGIGHLEDCRRPGLSKALLAAGVTGNIAVIFYYKYFNFFMENWNLAANASVPLRDILMPLGISFFTFQQISYLVDSWRGETKSYSFLDYCLFVSFFPQLIAGPIVTHEEMIPQFMDRQRKTLDQSDFAAGLYCFAVGLAKKVLLADTLGLGAGWGFANPGALSALDTLLVSLLYTFQLYFDFSGYCDMAYGIAKMFHIDLPLNFDSPYKADSIADFWRRWHMTLGRFFRKYLYFPMGGSRKGRLRTAVNTMTVFLVSGLWHGADWTFILWGGLHGVASVLYRVFKKPWDSLPRAVRRLLQFCFLNFAWMLFGAASLKDFGCMVRNLAEGSWTSVHMQLSGTFDVMEFTYLESHIPFLGNLAAQYPWLHMAFLLCLSALLVFVPENCIKKSRSLRYTPAAALFCVILLVWSVTSLSGVNVFLYFNF